MVLFINEELAKHFKEKYSIDITNDDNITVKNYNPQLCLARVWKSDDKYQTNAGGFSNYQCQYRPKDGSKFCECHCNKILPFGRIDEEKPKEPILTDIFGNKIRYFWIEDSEGLQNEFYSNNNKQEKTNEKRGRGRPPTKRQNYDTINWEEVCKNDELNNFTLDVLKKFLKDKNLDQYGRKENIIKRIYEHFNIQPNEDIHKKIIKIDNVPYNIDLFNNVFDTSGNKLGIYIRQLNSIQFENDNCMNIHERNKINMN